MALQQIKPAYLIWDAPQREWSWQVLNEKERLKINKIEVLVDAQRWILIRLSIQDHGALIRWLDRHDFSHDRWHECRSLLCAPS